MLLSGKLKPATVSVPLGLGLVVPPLVLPQAVAVNTRAARAARNLPEPNLGCIELFLLPSLGFADPQKGSPRTHGFSLCVRGGKPRAWPDSSIYAVLKVAARGASGAR